MISLFIAGAPVAQGRPRFARTANGVRTFDPKKSAEWKHFVRLRANSEGIKPFPQGMPLVLLVEFHISRPASVSKKKRPHPTVKPDLSNLLKGIEDGLNGIAWHDDAQVCQITMGKRYSDTPGVRICIWEMVEE